jgi:trk system potassium uptake protein TrkA
LANRNRIPKGNSVVVIGLGRFGGAVAESLIRLGHEVLGIDESYDCVQQWSGLLTHVVQADTTSIDTLRELGVGEFKHAVVGIGNNVEASVLTVLALEEMGVPDIWAKAMTAKHGRILERTGAHHVIFPEATMGARVAHLVTGRMIDFIELDDGYAIAKTRTPAELHGKTVADAALRSKFGVTIVGLKHPKAEMIHARLETVLDRDALMIVAGPTQQVERFAAMT